MEIIGAQTLRRRIKCPMCGKTFPLPFQWRISNPRSVSPCGSARPKPLRIGDLVLKPATYDVSRAGKEIALNWMEFRLLKYLMQRGGRVVSRKRLIQSAWDSKDRVKNNLLDVTISHLRKKVDRNHRVKLIRTVRNVGYSVRGPGNASATRMPVR
jgi:DNA-binding response OmpR family regulator